MGKHSKTQGTCIFCGASNVTKQHVWPDWLKSVIPHEGSEHTHLITRIDLSMSGEIHISPEIHPTRGPIGARKIRKICSKCNSGWMSRLESNSKPLLAQMILGERIVLNPSEQEILARWTMMTAIVAEFTDVKTQAITPQDRISLMNSCAPASKWRVWIGRYSGKEWTQRRYRHWGALMGALIEGQKVLFSKTCNMQTSTFVLGSLLIHATSSSVLSSAELDPFDTSTSASLLSIWPPHPNNVEWPPPKIISDSDAAVISDSLSRRRTSLTAKRPSWRQYGI